MKLVSGTIALCFAFTFFIFLGLTIEASPGSTLTGYYFFPVSLTLFALTLFWLEIKEKLNKFAVAENLQAKSQHES